MASRNNEYTGYIPASNPIDWAKLTGGLVSTITGIGESREAERQALDKLQSDNTLILQNTELGKSQSLNQLILSGSNDGRQSMMQWNRLLKSGQITPLEYKNRINNLMDSWSTFANTAKTYDQQMQEALKRQQEGLGSGLELELNSRIAQLGDLKNKKVQIDPTNGNFVIGQLNKDGMFDPSSIIDVRSISKPGNILDDKIDLASIADEKTKGLASWIIESGSKTVTDALQNPAVQKSIYDLTQGIMSNPRAITSILTDNTDGGYDFYYSNDDLKNKLQDRVAKENDFRSQNNKTALSGDELTKFIDGEKDKFIFLAQDDQGVYQPNLTNNQVKKARETTETAIKARLERKVELDEPQYYGGGGGGGGSSKVDPQNFAVAAYIASNRALDQGDFSNLDNDQYNFKKGSDSGKKYVEVTKRAYDERSGTYSNDPRAKKVKVYSADGLSQYVKGMDKQKNLPTSIYNSGKNDFFKLNNYTLPGTYKVGQSGSSVQSRGGNTGDPLGLGI